MKNLNSKFLRLNWKDIVRGLILAFLTVVVMGLYGIIQNGVFPTWETFKPILITGIGAMLAYIIKNVLTNSDDKFLVKEKTDA